MLVFMYVNVIRTGALVNPVDASKVFAGGHAWYPELSRESDFLEIVSGSNAPKLEGGKAAWRDFITFSYLAEFPLTIESRS